MTHAIKWSLWIQIAFAFKCRGFFSILQWKMFKWFIIRRIISLARFRVFRAKNRVIIQFTHRSEFVSEVGPSRGQRLLLFCFDAAFSHTRMATYRFCFRADARTCRWIDTVCSSTVCNTGAQRVGGRGNISAVEGATQLTITFKRKVRGSNVVHLGRLNLKLSINDFLLGQIQPRITVRLWNQTNSVIIIVTFSWEKIKKEKKKKGKTKCEWLKNCSEMFFLNTYNRVRSIWKMGQSQINL